MGLPSRGMCRTASASRGSRGPDIGVGAYPRPGFGLRASTGTRSRVLGDHGGHGSAGRSGADGCGDVRHGLRGGPRGPGGRSRRRARVLGGVGGGWCRLGRGAARAVVRGGPGARLEQCSRGGGAGDRDRRGVVHGGAPLPGAGLASEAGGRCVAAASGGRDPSPAGLPGRSSTGTALAPGACRLPCRDGRDGGEFVGCTRGRRGRRRWPDGWVGGAGRRSPASRWSALRWSRRS